MTVRPIATTPRPLKNPINEDLIYKGDDVKIHAFSLAKIKNGSSFTIGENRKTFIPVDQHFNWFQKLMWKWCFGVKVEDYSEE